MCKSKLSSILSGTCPGCRSSKMWSFSPFYLTKMFDMKKYCTNCGTNLEPEPSFYTGAMYVGYAFSVAIVFGVFIVSNLIVEKPNITIMSFISISSAILFAPLNLRLSRNIWAHLFF